MIGLNIFNKMLIYLKLIMVDENNLFIKILK